MGSDLCACCRRWGYGLARCAGGHIHLDCWSEHHSGPETVWPPDHVCAINTCPAHEARPAHPAQGKR